MDYSIIYCTVTYVEGVPDNMINEYSYKESHKLAAECIIGFMIYFLTSWTVVRA